MSSFGISQPFRCPSIVARMGRSVEKTEKVVKVEKVVNKPVYDSDNSDRTDHSDHSDDESDQKEDPKEEEKTRQIQCRLQFSNIALRFSANKNVDYM